MFQSRCERLITSKIPKFDQANLKSIFEVSDYAEEIHGNMKLSEKLCQPSSTYMKRQSDITESMRAILVDWLIDVHLKFKLLSETLFLTVNILDRYLSVASSLPRSKLQLAGVAAMLISTKYEEIYPPTVKDYVYITDSAYSREEILRTESLILAALDFNVQQTSQYRFLERYTRITRSDQVHFNLAQYFLELGLLDSKMAKFGMSEQAAAALFKAQGIIERQGTSTNTDITKMERHTGFT